MTDSALPRTRNRTAANRLSDAELRRQMPVGKHTDGGGLYLEVTEAGNKLWRYRYRINGREQLMAMGAYPEVSLAEARKARDAARERVKTGINPSHERKIERARRAVESAQTFVAVSAEWIEKRGGKWSASYREQVQRILQNDILPALGPFPMRQLSAAQILELMNAAEARGAATVALLIRQIVGAVFRYAVATLRADYDPAAALRGAIARGPVRNARALSKGEIREFFGKLAETNMQVTTEIALRLLAYTALRAAELRGARWSEIDFDRREWRIEAERMKKRRAHVVPLSRQALALLAELQAITGAGDFLFPNARRAGECMSHEAINRALERMGYRGAFAAHGFRATFSTLAHEAGQRHDLIEMTLAHAERNRTSASYNHARYLEQRRELMQWYADTLDALAAGGNVVVGPFQRSTA